jgi:hypothetical protein
MLVVAGCFALAAIAGDKPEPAKETKAPEGTHAVSKAIAIKSETKGIKLQTLSLGPDGMIYALLGPDRYGAKPTNAGEVQVLDATGEKIRSWKVEFLSQAINCAPDGTVLVAGDGKLAAFDNAGNVKSEIELPHVKAAIADSDKMKQKAEEQQKAQIESYEEMVKEQKKNLEELKAKDEDKLTKTEKQQIKQAESMVKAYERMLDQQKKQKIEDIVAQIVSRVKVINAVAATDKDVYVVSGETKGYGYAVWRMDRNFENPKQVMSGVAGCCGQMDIQASGDDLWVAQNCSHNVGHFDRDGKKIGTFGKRGRDGEADCFGGCCNPMNVRVGPAGRIFTAESEGMVRAFSADGKVEGLVGTVKIGGGCKNVAIAVSPDSNTIYFCDQPGSKIHVMTKKPDPAKGTED